MTVCRSHEARKHRPSLTGSGGLRSSNGAPTEHGDDMALKFLCVVVELVSLPRDHLQVRDVEVQPLLPVGRIKLFFSAAVYHGLSQSERKPGFVVHTATVSAEVSDYETCLADSGQHSVHDAAGVEVIADDDWAISRVGDSFLDRSPRS